jgi:hypothetical protein
LGFVERIPELSRLERILLVEALSVCDCCEEHQLNRPLTYIPHLPETAARNTGPKPCDCPCRHIARWICWHEYPDVVATAELL